MAPGSIKDRPNNPARRRLSFHPPGEGRNRLSQSREADLRPRISTGCITSRGSTRNCSRNIREGLIGMSGCLKGEINMAIQSDNLAKARQSAATFATSSARKISSSSCTITASRRSRNAIAMLPTIAQEFGLGLVAANDVHFLERGHHDAHDVMICIGTGKMVHDERRMRYTPELYFKSPTKCARSFRIIRRAITNTLAIAERCNLELEFGISKFPEYPRAGRQNRAKLICANFATRVCANAMANAPDDPS